MNSAGVVPRRLLTPLVNKEIQDLELRIEKRDAPIFKNKHNHNSRLSDKKPPAKEILSQRAGISTKKISEIVNHPDGFVTFDTADRLLIALGMEELWHTDPDFVFIYENLEKLEKEKNRQRGRQPSSLRDTLAVNEPGRDNSQ